MKEVQTLGVLPLGRPTFDVAFAEEKLKAMLDALAASGKTLCGPAALLMDESATRDAIAQVKAARPDAVLILQVTFTDAVATMAAASAFDVPLGIWAVPEPRLGGRLRLNAFCGLNLASHALGRTGRAAGVKKPRKRFFGNALPQVGFLCFPDHFIELVRHADYRIDEIAQRSGIPIGQ